MTDKEQAERYKMALEAIIVCVGHGIPDSWIKVAFSCREIAQKAIGDGK